MGTGRSLRGQWKGTGALGQGNAQAGTSRPRWPCTEQSSACPQTEASKPGPDHFTPHPIHCHTIALAIGHRPFLPPLLKPCQLSDGFASRVSLRSATQRCRPRAGGVVRCHAAATPAADQGPPGRYRTPAIGWEDGMRHHPPHLRARHGSEWWEDRRGVAHGSKGVLGPVRGPPGSWGSVCGHSEPLRADSAGFSRLSGGGRVSWHRVGSTLAYCSEYG